MPTDPIPLVEALLDQLEKEQQERRAKNAQLLERTPLAQQEFDRNLEKQ